MKPPVANSTTNTLFVAIMGAVLLGTMAGGALRAQSNDSVPVTPAVGESPAPTAKPGKKSKKPRESGETSSASKIKKPKEISFPLSINDPARELKIPENNGEGILLSLMTAMEAIRVDNEHVKMKEMNLDLYHPDGKEDFHIILPASVFNLQTRIITSADPVMVKTQDFELTGEKMEFNTVERTGKIIGKVRMLIHNFKPVAGQPERTPKPE